MLIDLYATALCCMLAIMSPYWVTGTYKAVSSCASFFLATGLEMKWPRFVLRELSGTFNTPCFSLGHFCYCWFSPSFKTQASKIFNPLSFEVVDSVSKYVSCPLKLFCPFFTFFFFLTTECLLSKLLWRKSWWWGDGIKMKPSLLPGLKCW